jgi:hypothetical protein
MLLTLFSISCKKSTTKKETKQEHIGMTKFLPTSPPAVTSYKFVGLFQELVLRNADQLITNLCRSKNSSIFPSPQGKYIK